MIFDVRGEKMSKTRRLATLSVLIALGMIFSYIESLVPAFVAIPGVKLGLANTVTVFALYMLGIPDAALVSLVRVILSSLLFGNTVSLLYSLVGAALSLAVMILCARLLRLSPIGVSALGGVFHNLGQTLTAALVLESLGVFFYFPVLIISGTLAGIVIGTVAGIITKRLDTLLKKR